MRSMRDIKKSIAGAEVNTESQADQAVLGDLMDRLAKAKDDTPTQYWSEKWRTTMKNPIIKLAAAVFAVAVVLGLLKLIDGDSTAGIVWADVMAKLQTSRGVIFRKTEHIVPDTYGRGADFDMNYYSSTKSRVDGYKGGQINKTIYSDCNTKTVVLVDNYHKSYVKAVGEERMPDSFKMADPKSMVERFLSREHKKLGQETIDGVLCEGIETMNPAFYGSNKPPESVMARIWVSVETEYPVQIEGEYSSADGQTHFDFVQDQFQWDVDLDERIFEPNIPAGYIDIGPP